MKPIEVDAYCLPTCAAQQRDVLRRKTRWRTTFRDFARAADMIWIILNIMTMI
jgi:hypothetical protein